MPSPPASALRLEEKAPFLAHLDATVESLLRRCALFPAVLLHALCQRKRKSDGHTVAIAAIGGA